jgi:hypothetical protein
LDDFLWAIDKFRREHRLSKPHFTRTQLSQYPGYDEALRNLGKQIVQRYGRGIYLFGPHPLSEELGIVLENNSVLKAPYQLYRVSIDTVQLVLEKTILLATQTAVQLPQKGNKVGHSTKALQHLAGRFESLAKQAELGVNEREAQNRITFYWRDNGETDPASFFHKGDDLRSFAQTLRNVTSTTRVSRSRFDSPNPQVQWATYVVGWIEQVTGTPNYTILQTLLDVTFSSAGQQTPKWVDRLPVEMAVRRRRRQAFAKSITVPAVG